MAKAHQRIVNGKVVQVRAFADQDTTTTNAARIARDKPGRPRMQASPGTYASGRDLPGQKAKRPHVKIDPPAPPWVEKDAEAEEFGGDRKAQPR